MKLRSTTDSLCVVVCCSVLHCVVMCVLQCVPLYMCGTCLIRRRLCIMVRIANCMIQCMCMYPYVCMSSFLYLYVCTYIHMCVRTKFYLTFMYVSLDV